jgi:hypothetical protein
MITVGLLGCGNIARIIAAHRPGNIRIVAVYDRHTERADDLAGRLVTGLLEGLHQGLGVAQETLPGGGELGAARPRWNSRAPNRFSSAWMRALTVDWVTCRRAAAPTKLPAAATARKVRANSMSIAASHLHRIFRY